jgi:hypothetical protein
MSIQKSIRQTVVFSGLVALMFASNALMVAQPEAAGMNLICKANAQGKILYCNRVAAKARVRKFRPSYVAPLSDGHNNDRQKSYAD